MGIQRGYALTLGDQVYLKIDNGQEEKEHQVKLNGLLYSPAQPPAAFIAEPVFYTTRERFRELTGEPNYSLILATVPHYTPEVNLAAADRLQKELEKRDIEVTPALIKPGGFRTRTNTPDRFIAQDVLDGVFLILTILAYTILILGLFLVYNTINAVISQQINQIGIMKAVGATLNQIVLIYFSTVFIYALLALASAIPLGALAGHGLRTVMVTLLGMTPGPFELSTTALLAQTTVALGAPLLAALFPIWSGASITVREAISTYGLAGTTTLLERLLTRLRFLPRLVSLTISNTFRNKRRVILTQITLVGAGIMFMMVLHLRATIIHTFSDVLYSIFEVNVLLSLSDNQRIAEVEALTLAQPEVKAVEMWGRSNGAIRPLGQPEASDAPQANLYGLPLPATTYHPQLRAGRWLQPEDQHAAVLNYALAQSLGVGVGDWVTLDLPLTNLDPPWQVVGLVYEPLDQESVLLPRETLLRETRQVGRAKLIRVQTVHSDEPSEIEAVTSLRALYESRGYEVQVSREDTLHRLTHERVDRMFILIYLLTGMAVMVAVVGAVALSGTLSINVLERTREIGVMRAIGASAVAVSGQFIGEGLILGWLSWLWAWPLSIPVGQLVSQVLSKLINTELIFQTSGAGVLYWFIIITVLSILASWFPAQKAAQTSVWESLAYV